MGNRDEPFLLSLIGVPLHHGPAEIAAHQQATKAALGDAVASGAFLNFVEGDERRAAGRAGAGPEAAAALEALQAALDPEGRFRYGVDHRPGR